MQFEHKIARDMPEGHRRSTDRTVADSR
jgi:hypothetical protein